MDDKNKKDEEDDDKDSENMMTRIMSRGNGRRQALGSGLFLPPPSPFSGPWVDLGGPNSRPQASLSIPSPPSLPILTFFRRRLLVLYFL